LLIPIWVASAPIDSPSRPSMVARLAAVFEVAETVLVPPDPVAVAA
jgi:hypothetical protein